MSVTDLKDVFRVGSTWVSELTEFTSQGNDLTVEVVRVVDVSPGKVSFREIATGSSRCFVPNSSKTSHIKKEFQVNDDGTVTIFITKSDNRVQLMGSKGTLIVGASIRLSPLKSPF